MKITNKLLITLGLCLVLNQCKKEPKTSEARSETAKPEVKEQIDPQSPYQLVVYRFNKPSLQFDFFYTLEEKRKERQSPDRLKTTEEQNKIIIDIAHSSSEQFSDSIRDSIKFFYHLDASNSSAIDLKDEEIIFCNSTNLYCFLTPENHKIIDQKMTQYVDQYKKQFDLISSTAEISILEVAKGITPEAFENGNTKEHFRTYKTLEFKRQYLENNIDESTSEPVAVEYEDLEYLYTLPNNEEVLITYPIQIEQKAKPQYKLIHKSSSSDYYSKLILHSSTKNHTLFPETYKHHVAYLTSPDYFLTNEIQKQLFERSFFVPPDFLHRIITGGELLEHIKSNDPRSVQTEIENVFSQMGIDIPAKGSIRFEPSTSRVIAILDTREIEKMEAILAGIGSDPPVQMRIDFELLKLSMPASGTSPEQIEYTNAEIVDKIGLLTQVGASYPASLSNTEVPSFAFECASGFYSAHSYKDTNYISSFEFQANHLNESFELVFPHVSPGTVYHPLFSTADNTSLLAVKIQYTSKEYDGAQR